MENGVLGDYILEKFVKIKHLPRSTVFNSSFHWGNISVLLKMTRARRVFFGSLYYSDSYCRRTF